MASSTLGHLGPYRLLNIVNTGQTSRIWQAYDDHRNDFVAIKVLLDRFRGDREYVHYLRWEYVVAGKMQSDRIIRIHDYQSNRGNPYLAIEWFAAVNLKQLIRRGVDRFAHQVPSIIEQAAEALVYFNQQGWVHRDVKPDNYLLNRDGELKLIDFALATRQKKGLSRLFPGKLKIQGTRSYMSPEQIAGKALDERADLYSLGCTIYELLSGKPPFTAANANELLMKHMKAAPPLLEAANRNVTPEFAQLIRQTMAKNPADRPKTMVDFLNGFRMVRIFKRPPRPPEEEENRADAE